jgi:hypothetical protein
MKRYIYIIGIAWLSFIGSIDGYATDKGAGKYAARLADVWDNWYVQVGLDMSLQNPYGYDFSKVFPNGKTFGVNAAVGRWFTPGLGLRARVNWENGIGLLENHHSSWIAPFGNEGKNMDRGGYMSFVGDVQLNLHNIFLGYDEERVWNFNVYPRAGIVYNFGVKKGSPLIGAGIGNTFRINERYSVYLDAAYQMVSSGFTGVEADTGTGTGSNSNGYFDISIGIQINLGKSSFQKP